MSKKILIIASVIVGLIAVGATAYVVLGQEGKEVEPDQPVVSGPEEPGEEIQPEEAATSKTIDTSDWKTYRNEVYGYEVGYPAHYTIQEDSYGTHFSPPGHSEKCRPTCPTFMLIHIEEVNSQLTLEDWIADRWPELEEFEEFEISAEESDGGIDCIKKTTIGRDIRGYLFHRWGQAWGSCYYYGKWKNALVIIYRAEIGLKCSDCSGNQIFNEMLFTFKFASN